MTLPPAIGAALLVLAASAAGSGDGDWELVVPGLEGPMCAKSEAMCLEAHNAVLRGRILTDLPAALSATYCRPHPSCFPARSNYIDGFNMPGELRR